MKAIENNFDDFKPMFDKSIYHTNPEEALQIAKDLNSKRVIGMHWGTFVLSLEPIMEPPKRFLESAKNMVLKIMKLLSLRLVNSKI